MAYTQSKGGYYEISNYRWNYFVYDCSFQRTIYDIWDYKKRQRKKETLKTSKTLAKKNKIIYNKKNPRNIIIFLVAFLLEKR